MGNGAAPIARIEKFRNIETINMPAVAGPTRTILPITEVMRSIQLVLKGTATEAGVADGLLTPEGVLSLIRQIKVVGTSSARREIGDIKVADFAALYQLAAFLKGTPPSYSAVSPLTKSSVASPFKAVVPLDFELLFSQDPRQTLLNTTELTSLSLLVDWGAAADLFTQGTWSFPTCTLEVNAAEFVEADSKAHRYGINQFSFIEKDTVSTNQRLAIDLKRGYLLRGVLIKQFTRNAVYYHTPVETVINSVSLELNRDVRKKANWTALQALNKEQFNMVSVPTGYAFLDLMPEGRFDSIIDTRAYRDVNIILDVNGVANSLVRVYPVEIIPAML